MAEKTRLWDLVQEGKLDISNVSDLPVTPKMAAADLQKKFDENTENLVKAIDTYVIDEMATKQELNEAVFEAGTGDMLKSTYDPDNDGVVEKAKTAMSIDTSTIEDVAKQIGNYLYPVGSIYMTASTQYPADLFGGTWERWGEGRVPVGVKSTDSDFNVAEKTGGSKTHTHAIAARTSGATTLTTSQIPKHTHGSRTLTGSFKASDNVVRNVATATPIFISGTGIVTVSAYTHTVCETGNMTMKTKNSSDVITINATHEHNSVGGGGSHTHSIPQHTSGSSPNLMEYITCYMWKRVG